MNFDPETGIAYGYISANELDSEVVDNLMYRNLDAVNLTFEDAQAEFLAHAEIEHGDDTEFDESEAIEKFLESYEEYEPIIEGELEGVKYRSSWLGGALHFWVFKSDYVGCFVQCSPCVPGAADLSNPNENGIAGYSIPPDWFAKHENT